METWKNKYSNLSCYRNLFNTRFSLKQTAALLFFFLFFFLFFAKYTQKESTKLKVHKRMLKESERKKKNSKVSQHYSIISSG